MTSPLRVRRTHPGGAPAPPLVCSDHASVCARRWNANPFATEVRAKAWREPGASDSRIITPAFDQLSAAEREATRAMTSRSPLTGLETKWNWSCESQISAPLARMVYCPLEYSALPAMAGAPMSTLDSPLGSSPSGGGADALIDTFETEATVRMPG